MHLSRVRVPNFRALKNVDITFEEHFEPRIFPLASINGGGKSTLLQYLFILLGCSSHPESREMVINLLADFPVAETNKVLSIEASKNNTIQNLTFFLEKQSIFEGCISEWLEEEHITHGISEEESEELFINADTLTNHDYYSILHENQDKTITLLSKLNYFIENLERIEKKYTSRVTLEKLEIHQDLIRDIQTTDYSFCSQVQRENGFLSLTTRFFIARYRYLIHNFYSFKKMYDFSRKHSRYNIATIDINGEDYLFFCQSSAKSNPFELLHEISQKIHFLSSKSQVFLFLNREERKTLFRKSNNSEKNYAQILSFYCDQLNNFYVHDFIPINALLKSFEIARDEDFKQKTRTGQYGKHYDQLDQEIMSILPNKKVIPQDDLSSVYFSFVDNPDYHIQPEDLSHGELKRLSIYLWLKNQKVKDSIILIDEIETGLHPDWQYQIIRDFQDYFPDNQFIIATHSYAMCEAVTPAHVKEISPEFKLNNQE